MSEPKVIRGSVRMAKADEKDMDAGYYLMNVLDDLDRGYYPELHDERDPNAPDFFDEDDRAHLQHLHGLLKKILDKSPGFMGRVMGGMSCFLNPVNAVIDPDADTIEFHPGLRRHVEWSPFDPTKMDEGTWWTCGRHGGIADFDWKDGAWHHPSSRAHCAQGPVGVDLGVQFVHPFFGRPDPPTQVAEALEKG